MNTFLTLAASITLVWNPNPPAQQIIGYHLWEGFVIPMHPPLYIKNNAIITQSNVTVNFSSGQHICFVTAYSLFGESIRSKGIVVIAP